MAVRYTYAGKFGGEEAEELNIQRIYLEIPTEVPEVTAMCVVDVDKAMTGKRERLGEATVLGVVVTPKDCRHVSEWPRPLASRSRWGGRRSYVQQPRCRPQEKHGTSRNERGE